MTRNEAELILELGPNYTKEEMKKKYKKLLLLNHPDNKRNEKSMKEQGEKTKKIIEAYTLLLHGGGGVEKISLEKFSFLNNEIKATEALENRYLELPITSMPAELQMAVEETFSKYRQIVQIVQVKLYNLESKNIMKSLEAYEEEYYNIRSDLTYCFFNYLENNSSSLIYVKNTLHSKNSDEYCGNEFSPIIEDSLYEIIKKFLNYFPLFLIEKKKLQTEMQKNIIKELETITSKYKETAKPEAVKEYNLFMEKAIKRVMDICNVSPLQNINCLSLNKILQEYEALLANLKEGYEFFLENKDIITKELEEKIKSLSDSSTKEFLLEKVSKIYLIEQKERFELEFSKIVVQLEKTQFVLPTETESSQFKRVLKHLDIENLEEE